MTERQWQLLAPMPMSAAEVADLVHRVRLADAEQERVRLVRFRRTLDVKRARRAKVKATWRAKRCR